MKTSFLVALISLVLSIDTFAMGAKRPPSPTVPSTPTIPTTPPVSGTKPTLDFGEELPTDEYLNTSAEVGPRIDIVKKDDELSGKIREKINDDAIDKCFDDEDTHEYFADQISYYTQEMMNDVPAKVGFIGSSYGTSSDDSKYFPTSLIRHSLCVSTSDSLKKTLKNNYPSTSTIAKMNQFENKVNDLRMDVLNGDQSAKKELLSTWTRMFSCLAYSESLPTADSNTSKNVASKVSPTGYRKPSGVEFYEDPDQTEASRLNIGMYQFTPDSTGNVQPCIRAWNELHNTKPACLVSQKASKSDLIKVFGSSLQSFNAFCGVHKLIQTFAIQVNTTKTSATHPRNVVNGKIKAAEERCVSPNFYKGWAYNHFGPFQNSTGSNLNELMSCTLSNQ
ncbi:MAG: hypothetical protein K2Q18_18735 [Bdellovibrionales bacterium]|nr:hypothetical protein [Bdellovibrionales bacterium]